VAIGRRMNILDGFMGTLEALYVMRWGN